MPPKRKLWWAALIVPCVTLVALWAFDRAFPPNLTRYQFASTEILASDGTLLRAFPVQGGVWRLRTNVADVDPHYVALLIAAEDRHFYTHPGVDPAALLRAAWQLARNGRIISGGSTLTMQTARLLEPHRRGLTGKLHDIARAVQLEHRYSKDQILGIYLTLCPFGGNLEGVRAASLAYFGQEPGTLSTYQATLLVALPQSPSARRPDLHPLAAERARQHLLTRLGLSDPIATTQIQRRRLPLHAAAFAANLARSAPAGARVVSTINAPLQTSLESLIARAMAADDRQEGVALLAINNHNRSIEAAISGRGLDYPGGFLDLTQTRRSPGSALKPFIYGMAFDALLLHPQTLISDAPGQIADYAPHNFDSEFHGEVTATVALSQSFNVSAVQVLAKVGPRRFIAALRQAGAIIALPNNRPNLAVALGGEGINLRDLTMLYAALATDGRTAPLQSEPGPAPPRTQFMGRLAVYYLRQILQQSPPPPDMAYASLTGSRPVAFKTGTSYGFRDAWAVGYTATTTIGVWMGRVDGSPRPGRFGRNSAAPLMLKSFDLLPAESEADPSPPPDALLVTDNQDLPPHLRHFSTTNPTAEAFGPRVAYPPNGTRIDLLAQAGGYQSVTLRASGGTAPLRWFVNGAPRTNGDGTTLSYTPDGAGFVHATVVDAQDRSNSVIFRLASPAP